METGMAGNMLEKQKQIGEDEGIRVCVKDPVL